ncbi:MAG: NUDIX hydrolase [Deltaproteobacteria bacterium]|nr:NUDIX hydrolase [Deltaproteobacteria bacterium]
MPFSYPYFHPAVTVDCVVFGLDLAEAELKVMLIRRKLDPYKGSWALPGGFVHEEESLDEAAKRELTEETGLESVWLEQLYTFGAPGRDPRERVISVTYFALLKSAGLRVQASTDAAEAAWFSAAHPPPLAFDHAKILEKALERLKGKVRYQPIGFELLPPKFTLTQLQRLYEIVLDRPLDKRNFRKKVLATQLLLPLNEKEEGVAHRAAQLFRFDQRTYQRLSKQGYLFEV